MAKWTIRYTASFEAEFLGQPFEVQDALETRLEVLVQLSPAQWLLYKHVERLAGKDCERLLEIRFKALDVQHRPIGFYGPGKMTFTLALWMFKKDRIYVPKNYCLKGKKIRRRVLEVDEESEESEATYVWPIEK